MDNGGQEIIELLTTRGYRITGIRCLIIDLVSKTRHFTVKYLLNQIKRKNQHKAVNLMTIYNTINLLIKEHLLFANSFNGKDIVYELITPETIHAVCDRCLKVTHLDQIDPETILQNQTIIDRLKVKGWEKMAHYKLEIHSLCQDCKSK